MKTETKNAEINKVEEAAELGTLALRVEEQNNQLDEIMEVLGSKKSKPSKTSVLTSVKTLVKNVEILWPELDRSQLEELTKTIKQKIVDEL